MSTRKALAAGDVVIVPFPFTDLTSKKVRPALVLSRASYNARSPDAILCAITSQLTESAHSVIIENADMAEGKLLKPSRIKVGVVASVDQSIVRARIGKLKPATYERVRRELDSILEPA